MSAVITLTTDFGTDSPYVAAMKGVMLGINPAAQLIDLSHAIPPQDVRHAAHILAGCVPCFPPGTIHLVVVDPGVGTARAGLHVDIAGQHLIAPDNGCWTLLPGSDTARVRRLSERRFWREPVSHTFHGRDVFAPTAAHLSCGVSPAELGPLVDTWQRVPDPQPTQVSAGWDGEIVFVDHFGNLITNLPGQLLPENDVHVLLAGHTIDRRVDTYGQAEAGTLVVLVSSDGRVEIAVVNGNAAARLAAGVGCPVQLRVGAARGNQP